MTPLTNGLRPELDPALLLRQLHRIHRLAVVTAWLAGLSLAGWLALLLMVALEVLDRRLA
jgi:hypothetical protein